MIRFSCQMESVEGVVMTVLVTGATGTVGRLLVHHLLEAGQQVRALTRNPAAAALPDGVEVVAGDVTDAATLAPAFDGVTAAHLITFGGRYRPLTNGPEIVEQAVRAGVRGVTLLGGWQEGSLEPAVRDSELEWTHLLPVEFMANTLTDWGALLRTKGVVREPYGDRKSPPVHESDIAAVAAVALTRDGHAGKAYSLTGPALITPREKVRILAAAAGRDLRFEELTPDQARKEWVEEGAPPDLLVLQVLAGASPAEQVEFLLHVYGSASDRATTVTGAVEQVTGRPPRTFAQWAAEHADAFRAAADVL
jgi:uncharacterized protein YbjT (DUF2867 family)